MAKNQNDYHYWEGSFKGLLPDEILGLSDKDFQILYEEFLDARIDSSYLEELIEDDRNDYEEEGYLEGRVLRNVFEELLDDLGYFHIDKTSKEIDLFRSISVNNISEINFDELGICWTYSAKNLNDYIEESILPQNTYLTRFYGVTPIENVDWIESLFLYINYSTMEKELRVYNSNKVFLKGYINIDYSIMVEYSSYGEISDLLGGVTTQKELLSKRDSLLKEYNKVTKRYDYTGDLSKRDLKYFVSENKDGFTINFGEITGNFDCSGLGLTSLKGAPQTVGGSFYCHKNQLTSLEGAPQKIGGDFNCSYSHLTSLEGAPKTVSGSFSCSNNNLTSLEGAPQKVGDNFSCSYNELIFLKGAPRTVGKNFYCNNNRLTSLEGAPTEVDEDFNCSWNNLTSLEGAPRKVGDDFSCSKNSLTSLKGAPREVSGDFYCQRNPNLHSLDGIGEVKKYIYKDF